jgi:hypothetical protein
MIKGALGIGAMALALLGQVEPSVPMQWISNIGAMGLLVILLTYTLPKMSKSFTDALAELTKAITALRVHCATKTGELQDDPK